jgi:leader peptidase (prepilin peptidase)/N-methyltransferase
MAGLVFLVGLILGWLLNIVIIRLPQERSFLRWPPRCTRTNERLALWQLLPVLGWLLQRGKARDGRPISWVHPLVELLTAVAVLLFYAAYGFSPTFFYLVFVAAILIITGAIDWLHRWIYTFVILGSVPVVLLGSLAIEPMTLQNSGFGAIVGGIGFILLYLLARLLFPSRSVPFGLGDVYLGIFLGAAVGLTRLGPVLWYGILMAGIVSFGIVFAKYALRRRDMPEYISYGTYLCLGALFYLMVWGL